MESKTIALRAVKLIRKLLCPERHRETNPTGPLIDIDSYKEYFESQEANCVELIELICKHDKLLIEFEMHNDVVIEFRQSLVKFLCEQTTKVDFPFRVKSDCILGQLKMLYEGTVPKLLSEKLLYDEILVSYKQRLNAEKWQNHLGDIFSFNQFIWTCFSKLGFRMNRDELYFILSVGTLLVNYWEEEFKLVGLDLFKQILYQDNLSILFETQGHCVVMWECKNLVYSSIKDPEFNRLLWDLIFRYIRINDTIIVNYTGNWNEADDILETAFDRVLLESDDNMITIMYFIARVMAINLEQEIIDVHLNRDEVEEQLISKHNNDDDNMPFKYNAVTKVALTAPFHFTCRWTKSIMNILQFGASKSNMNLINFTHCIHAMHIIYIISIYPLPQSILPKFNEFIDKLMESLIYHKTNQQDPVIKKMISLFMGTIVNHLGTMKEYFPYEELLIKLC